MMNKDRRGKEIMREDIGSDGYTEEAHALEYDFFQVNNQAIMLCHCSSSSLQFKLI